VDSAVSVPATQDLRRATRATHAAFFATGAAGASWLARIPQVQQHLRLDSSALGMITLASSGGAVIALLLAGPAIARFGSRRTVAAMALVSGAGLLTIGVGYRFDVAPVVVGLFLFGFGQGAWDVAMNTQGTMIEHSGGRSLLPRFHAVYSVGTVSGGLIGAGMVALGVPVQVHLALVGILVAIAIPYAVRDFIPDRPETERPPPTSTAWREPRTLLIGLFMLAFAFAEGTGNGWISVAFVDDYRTTPTVAAFGVSVFLAAMTAGRWFGPMLLVRCGRVRAVRVLGVVSIVGVLLFAAGVSTPFGLVGALLWGIGASLGFPVGLSAAADDRAMAPARVGVCSTIAYTAFLGGSPLVGFLGDKTGVTHAIAAVAVLLVFAVPIAGVLKPRKGPTP
jgi:fucose permease